MAEKGLDILVSVNTGTVELPVYTVVAGQKNCTLNRSAEAIDVTSKTSGGWKESITGFKEWSVDCDGLLAFDDEGYMALEDAFMTDKPVMIEIAKKTGKMYKGTAIITDFPLEASYEDVATYSVSFSGTGALE